MTGAQASRECNHTKRFTLTVLVIVYYISFPKVSVSEISSFSITSVILQIIKGETPR